MPKPGPLKTWVSECRLQAFGFCPGTALQQEPIAWERFSIARLLRGFNTKFPGSGLLRYEERDVHSTT